MKIRLKHDTPVKKSILQCGKDTAYENEKSCCIFEEIRLGLLYQNSLRHCKTEGANHSLNLSLQWGYRNDRGYRFASPMHQLNFSTS